MSLDPRVLDSRQAFRPPPQNASRVTRLVPVPRRRGEERMTLGNTESLFTPGPEETIVRPSDVPRAARSRGSGPSATCRRRTFRSTNESLRFPSFLSSSAQILSVAKPPRAIRRHDVQLAARRARKTNGELSQKWSPA